MPTVEELAAATTPGPSDYAAHEAALKTKTSAPAFTIGGRTGEAKPLNTPSPLNYNTEPGFRSTVKRSPSVKLGSPPKQYEKPPESPGPGAYKVDIRRTVSEPPSFSMSFRREAAAEALGPGPNNYSTSDVASLSTKKNAPAFSMGTKTEPSKTDPTPGPYLDHETATRVHTAAPAFTMSGKNWDLKPQGTPSPLDYRAGSAYRRMSKHTPASIITSMPKPPPEPLQPGPAAYAVENADRVTATNAPKFTMVGRRKTLPALSTPGPAAYGSETASLAVRSKAPAFTMSFREVSKEAEDTPGPNRYNIRSARNRTLSMPPAFTMSSKTELSKPADTPGPNQYTATPVKQRAPSFSMGVKTAEVDKMNTPGVGAYTLPEMLQTKRGAIITGKPKETGGSQTPSAADYSPSSTTKHRSPAFTMGARTKNFAVGHKGFEPPAVEQLTL